MTIPSKPDLTARRYRIPVPQEAGAVPGTVAANAPGGAGGASATVPETDPERAAAKAAVRGAPSKPANTPHPAAPASPAGDEAAADAHPAPAQADLDAITAEGISVQNMRLARRLAQKHALPAQSDAEAVFRLRHAGIDPFSRAEILALDTAAPPTKGAPPKTAPSGPPKGPLQGAPAGGKPAGAPSAPPAPNAGGQIALRPDAPVPAGFQTSSTGAAEVLTIQRDILRRRRNRMLLLLVRLVVLVGLPTVLTGYYLGAVATPLFPSQAEMVIQHAERAQAQGGGGLLSGGGALGAAQDSVAVQGYLQSREAMLRLDADHAFRAAFSGDQIDPILRLPDGATTEAAYRLYKRQVRISFDPTEGLIRMEVRAPDPAQAVEWSRALISYAEEQVDNLTLRMRGDQMAGARQSYADAEAAMQAAQTRVVALQERFNVMSGDVEVSLITNQISNLDAQLLQDQLSLIEIESAPSPNRARIEGVQRRIDVLQAQISQLRARLTSSGSSGKSLASIQGELTVAQGDVETRKMLLAQSLQALEAARVEANRQVRYLSVSVSPLEADEASYPRALTGTAVAFLIFLGGYLILAMTAAVLREQVAR